ncbi:MAG: peptidoglycan-binding protein [Cytophagales bacterium]|nr:MAG: peptidoglycan-binding protein [Cytophagales bacterium]
MIRKGSKGDEVREWQDFLANSEGYEIDVDGVFGQGTHEATVDFQQVVGLPADGVVGANTYYEAAERGYEGGYST